MNVFVERFTEGFNGSATGDVITLLCFVSIPVALYATKTRPE